MENNNGIFVSTGNLERLSRILNYQLSTSVLLIGYYFSPVLYLAIIAAVLFAPYMLFVLFREKRFGWITFFIILVLCPIFISLLFFYHTEYFIIFMLIPLALFYFYCFLLKITIGDWVQERNAKNERCNNLEEQLNDIINKEL